MRMRVQSMPLVAADAGSWIDVILLRRVDGRELQPMAIDAQPAIIPSMPLFAADASSWIDVILLRRVDDRELQPMAIDAQPAIIPARCGCECKACLSSPPMPVAGSMSHCSGVRMVEHVDESQPMAIDAQPAIIPARCGCKCKACVSSPPMPVAGSMSHCSGVWMVESCSRWPSMLSRPSLQLDADAMQMRVQSMPLVAADAGSWIDVTLLRRADGRARG
jgi:NAD-dependent dihydropyrimidine dehydrogenase PreA subunit